MIATKAEIKTVENLSLLASRYMTLIKLGFASDLVLSQDEIQNILGEAWDLVVLAKEVEP